MTSVWGSWSLEASIADLWPKGPAGQTNEQQRLWARHTWGFITQIWSRCAANNVNNSKLSLGNKQLKLHHLPLDDQQTANDHICALSRSLNINLSCCEEISVRWERQQRQKCEHRNSHDLYNHLKSLSCLLDARRAVCWGDELSDAIFLTFPSSSCHYCLLNNRRATFQPLTCYFALMPVIFLFKPWF